MPASSINPSTVPPPIGQFSQAILTSGGGRYLHISGQVGMRLDNTVANDLSGQTEAIWENIVSILKASQMDSANLIKVVTYLTDASYVAEFSQIRAKYLGGNRPASTLVIVKSLIKPEWLVEVEAVAFSDN